MYYHIRKHINKLLFITDETRPKTKYKYFAMLQVQILVLRLKYKYFCKMQVQILVKVYDPKINLQNQQNFIFVICVKCIQIPTLVYLIPLSTSLQFTAV